MRRTSGRRHLLWMAGALAIAVNSPAWAQYRIDSWTTEHGLPQSSVTGVLQTRDGFLWLTTFGGLVRFDGAILQVFNTVNEDLIAGGMKEGYRFRAIVGVDHAGEKQPDLFKTWNGRESIYILDEDGRVMDLTTDNQFHVDSRAARARASRDAAARRRRRKMAQQSRKRNRR